MPPIRRPVGGNPGQRIGVGASASPVRVTGVDTTLRRLRSYSDDVQKSIRNLLREEGTRVRREAKANAPRGATGRLKQSIRKRTRLRGLQVRVGTGLYYASKVEFGVPAYGREPRPFVFPAAREGKRRIAQRLPLLLGRSARRAKAA